MSRTVSCTLLALFLCVVSARVNAQTRSAVEGRVYDVSQAGIAGAQLLLEEVETGSRRRASTDETGYYRVLRLSPGTYQIQARAPGFSEQVRSGVRLSPGESTRADFVLQVGSPDVAIEVAGETSLINQSVSDWGGEVPRKELASLPLNGRDLFELSSLEVGASVPTVSDKGLTSGQGTQISVFGSRPNMNAFQLDGAYINDATGSVPSSAAGFLLGLESIDTVHIVTSPFSAENGRTAGALLTAVSKSGSNDLHGSLFGFFRNSALDAKNYFDVTDEAIPPLRRSQFGGSVGGPIVSSKAFFFLSFEGLRGKRGETVRPVVPTAEARDGLLPGPGGEFRRIDVSPAVVPYLSLFPLPNGEEFGDGTAEFINETIQTTREDYVSGKIDLNLSERVQTSARYTFDDGESSLPDPLRIWKFAQDSRYQFLHGQLQWIRSPGTIGGFVYSLSRVRNSEISNTRGEISPSLSFVEGQPLGSIQVTGLEELGGIRARLRPRSFAKTSFQVGTDWVHMSGKQTWKWGLGFDRIFFDQVADLSAVGLYRFSSLEDFLSGRARVGEVMAPGSDTRRSWRFNQFFAYLQDEARLRQDLSLSLGVRYEMATTPTEIDGKVATLPDPLHDTEMTVGGQLFRNPSLGNFAPRIALAWHPFGHGRTVIRAGAGIFFDLLGTRELVVAGVRVPPYFNRVNVFHPDFPDIIRSAEEVDPPKSLDGLDYYLDQPYVSRWQLSFEHQLARDLVMALNYAGSRGVHLPGQVGNINPTQPEVTADGRLYFPLDGPRVNPAFTNIGMRRTAFSSSYHSFSAELTRRWGRGLSYRFKYTFGKSIDDTSNTIYADFFNSDLVPMVFDYRQNRGRSDFDIEHVFSGSLLYDLPFAPSGVAGLLAGGWSVQGLAQAHSGHPFAPTVGFDDARLMASSGDLGQRPNQAVPITDAVILGDPQRYFDPLAFSLPEAGFYGDLGRGTLTGPGLMLIDLALQKVVWKSDQQRLRFRGEFFNVLNHPNFQIPSGLRLFNSQGQRLGTAGRITETSTSSRQVQLALRYEF